MNGDDDLYRTAVLNQLRPGQPPARDARSRFYDEMEKLRLLYQQRPDMAPREEVARQQYQAAGEDVAPAMLLQALGGRLAPVGGQVLRQAMAAREPQRVTGGEIIGGRFVEDPYAAHERRLKGQEFGVRTAELAATHEETQAGRAETRRLAEERERRMEQQYATTFAEAQARRAEAGAERDERRGRTATAATDRLEARQTADVTKRTDNVRREYNVRLDKVRQGSIFADQVVQALADPSIANNAPAQVALVMQFGKMLDPDSVVREAEQAMIARARGFADQLQQQIPRLMTGARLTPDQLRKMQQVAIEYQRGASTRVQDLNDFYAGLAQRGNLPTADIIQGRTSPPGGPPVDVGSGRGTPDSPIKVVPRGTPAPAQAGVSPITKVPF